MSGIKIKSDGFGMAYHVRLKKNNRLQSGNGECFAQLYSEAKCIESRPETQKYLLKNKYGFTIIELMIAIAISSIVSMVLFAVLFQVQRTAQIVNNDVSIGIQVMTVYERLQKDLTGMCWPQFIPAKIKQPTRTKNANQEGLNDANLEKKLGQIMQKFVSEPEEQVEPASPNIAKIIFSENSRFNELENLKTCSFITSSPLQVYNDTKPRITRVIYTLELESTKLLDRFVLYRQESQELDYNQAKSDAVKYSLLTGVRALNLTYFFQELSQKQDANKDQASILIKKQELELNQESESEQDQQQDNQEQSLAGRVPSYIKINLSMWTSLDQKDYQDFEFWFYVNNLVLE